MNYLDKSAYRGARIGVCLLAFLFLCAACAVQTEDIVACYGMREVLSLGGQPADTFPVVGVYEEEAAKKPLTWSAL